MARRDDLLPAALVAGIFSGTPSTIHALVTRRSLRAAVTAAGELLGRPGVVRGAIAHSFLTIGWTSVLLVALPRRATVAWGAVAGAAIGLADLAIADRRFPAIAALPACRNLPTTSHSAHWSAPS